MGNERAGPSSGRGLVNDATAFFFHATIHSFVFGEVNYRIESEYVQIQLYTTQWDEQGDENGIYNKNNIVMHIAYTYLYKFFDGMSFEHGQREGTTTKKKKNRERTDWEEPKKNTSENNLFNMFECFVMILDTPSIKFN